MKRQIAAAISLTLAFWVHPAIAMGRRPREMIPSARSVSIPSEKEEQFGRERKRMALKECQELAFSRYRAVRVAKEKLKLAKAKLTEAERAFLPSVSGKFEDGKGNLSSGKFRARRYGLEGEYYISKGGQVEAAYKQAKVKAEIANKEFQKVKEDLELDVAKAYYRLAKAQSDETIAGNLFDDSRELLKLARGAYEAGIISLRDLMALSARCEEIAFRRAQAKSESDLASLALRHALNALPEEGLHIECVLDEKSLGLTLEDCLDLAFKHRPEISIERNEVAYAQQTKRIARSRGLPWVVVVGTAGRGAEVWAHEDMKLHDEWSLVGKVSWAFGASTAEYSYTMQKQAPALSTVRSLDYAGHSVKLSFLDDLKHFSEKAQAEVEYQKALEELEASFKRVTYEVGESYYGFKSSIAGLDSAKTKAEYKRLDHEIVAAMKDMGKASLLELLESCEELAKAESGYKEAAAQVNVAHAKLARDVGTNLGDDNE